MSTEAKLRCLNMKQHAQIFVSSMCACIVHTDDFGRCAVVVVPRLAVLCWLVPITAAAAKFVWRQAGLGCSAGGIAAIIRRISTQRGVDLEQKEHKNCLSTISFLRGDFFIVSPESQVSLDKYLPNDVLCDYD